MFVLPDPETLLRPSVLRVRSVCSNTRPHPESCKFLPESAFFGCFFRWNPQPRRSGDILFKRPGNISHLVIDAEQVTMGHQKSWIHFQCFLELFNGLIVAALGIEDEAYRSIDFE